MNTVCHNEACCLTIPSPGGSAGMTHGANSQTPVLSATVLARELSEAARHCRTAQCAAADLARLDALANQAVAHVQRVGIDTVDHIVLSGTLKMLVRDIPALGNTLQHAGWQWAHR
jgi:hypothetical protein